MKISDCHVLKISKYDIANGPGVRVTVWVSGCSHHCEGCHNPETWKWNQGKPLDKYLIEDIVEACNKPYIAGLTISGGDPLFPKNREGVFALCSRFKEKYGKSKTIWIWTGYTLQEVEDDLILDYIDTLVDGKYIEALKDVSRPYTGSSNQRVIHFVRWGLSKENQ